METKQTKANQGTNKQKRNENKVQTYFLSQVGGTTTTTTRPKGEKGVYKERKA